MKKVTALAALLLTLALLLTACAPSGLFGRWTNFFGSERFTFRPNGGVIVEKEGKDPVEGCFSLHDGHLRMMFPSYSIEGDVELTDTTLTLIQGENRFLYFRENAR